MGKKVKKRKKINYQKIFCFSSFVFILVCILWYGGRFIYFYLDNHKSLTELESTTFATDLKEANYDSKNLKKINKDYYFYGNVNNNYVSYSNLLWRIVKINEDDSVMLITDNIIGNLAYGDANTSYQDSNLINWLNNDNNGKFTKILNNKEKYLIETSTCTDTIDNIEKITCKNNQNNYYLGLLSIKDYLNTGGNNSFINNNKYNYLANKNSDNEIWYITNEGKIDTTDGKDILGFKATITLTSKTTIISGAGTKEDPYKFEDTTGLIGSYVKLAEDTWRIYEEKEGIIKLVLQDTIKDNNEALKYNYSKNSHYHNTNSYGSLAYYLNNTYYKSLSYKDLIIKNTYSNGIYNNENNYDYEDISSKTVETKITVPSIDDIILNDNITEYFTNTGKTTNSKEIYIHKNNGFITSKNVTTENYIVPCISIKRENLKAGSGNYSDPYRTE